ncbi:MAG: hypothetical protein EOO00_06745 [Chitinophagaceae bacterium]|nr:MAG: hypothetical protein EOO00_06745 [Chitinophagaceae bacterium]
MRIFLITPKDRRFNQRYLDALKMCASSLKDFYRNEMGGKTFVLNNPIVDTLTGLHNADWYNADNGSSSGTMPRFYAFYNTLNEMKQLLGNDFNTNLYMNAVYVAAPGDGAGIPGFCAMGDQDLDGLLGINPSDNRIGRWIGGSGHEWGHGFGLPHPTDPEEQSALMGFGYLEYPNTFLLPADKAVLNGSMFFR